MHILGKLFTAVLIGNMIIAIEAFFADVSSSLTISQSTKASELYDRVGEVAKQCSLSEEMTKEIY